MQAKDYATAGANLTKLLDIGFRDPNGLRFTLAQLAEEQKDWPRAIGWYDSIKRGEHAMPARLRTANALAKQGKLDEARKYLQAVNAGEGERVQLQIAEAQRCAKRSGTRTRWICSARRRKYRSSPI
jgi:tetratricopeptide (TPR) repeat protein